MADENGQDQADARFHGRTRTGGRRMNKKHFPMIRLVIQLVDTPDNRTVMNSIHNYAKKKKVQGPHGVLKREDVHVIDLQTTQPCKSSENSQAQTRPALPAAEYSEQPTNETK